MIKRFFVLMIFIFGLAPAAFAQQHTVTGTIKDDAGEPIWGATVMVEGSTVGAMTDENGKYSIEAPADAVLSYSFIGFAGQQIPVGGRAVIDVVLKMDSETLDDVIVVAFGTTKKEAFTGSATTVKSEDITKSQQSNIAQSLAGKVAGVQLSNTSGQPGTNPEIRIRGFSSLNAGNSPLWIVDGMPYSGDLNNLNPSDVESMTVLKDAASNALYGARGANGVVMITTKRARDRKPVFNVDAKWGVNSRAVQDYDYIDDPAVFYETHYNALRNYYLGSGMNASEAHAPALPTTAVSDIWSIPCLQARNSSASTEKSILPLHSEGRWYTRARNIISFRTTGPTPLSAHHCVRSTMRVWQLPGRRHPCMPHSVTLTTKVSRIIQTWSATPPDSGSTPS